MSQILDSAQTFIRKLFLLFLFLVVSVMACRNQTAVSTSQPVIAVTPVVYLPTWTPEPIIPRPPPTFTPGPVPTFTSRSTLGRTWFPLTELFPAETVTSDVARSFIGIRVPPFPENIIREFSTEDVSGETSPSTIIHQAIVVRQGNARMLWVGVQFWPTSEGSEAFTRVYDAIPLPATQPGDVLVAFTCGRNNESDPSLIVLFSEEEPGLSLRYAWRIDPTSTTLELVSHQDIICWSE